MSSIYDVKEDKQMRRTTIFFMIMIFFGSFCSAQDSEQINIYEYRDILDGIQSGNRADIGFIVPNIEQIFSDLKFHPERFFETQISVFNGTKVNAFTGLILDLRELYGTNPVLKKYSNFAPEIEAYNENLSERAIEAFASDKLRKLTLRLLTYLIEPTGKGSALIDNYELELFNILQDEDLDTELRTEILDELKFISKFRYSLDYMSKAPAQLLESYAQKLRFFDELQNPTVLIKKLSRLIFQRPFQGDHTCEDSSKNTDKLCNYAIFKGDKEGKASKAAVYKDKVFLRFKERNKTQIIIYDQLTDDSKTHELEDKEIGPFFWKKTPISIVLVTKKKQFHFDPLSGALIMETNFEKSEKEFSMNLCWKKDKAYKSGLIVKLALYTELTRKLGYSLICPLPHPHLDGCHSDIRTLEEVQAEVKKLSKGELITIIFGLINNFKGYLSTELVKAIFNTAYHHSKVTSKDLGHFRSILLDRFFNEKTDPIKLAILRLMGDIQYSDVSLLNDGRVEQAIAQEKNKDIIVSLLGVLLESLNHDQKSNRVKKINIFREKIIGIHPKKLEPLLLENLSKFTVEELELVMPDLLKTNNLNLNFIKLYLEKDGGIYNVEDFLSYEFPYNIRRYAFEKMLDQDHPGLQKLMEKIEANDSSPKDDIEFLVKYYLKKSKYDSLDKIYDLYTGTGMGHWKDHILGILITNWFRTIPNEKNRELLLKMFLIKYEEKTALGQPHFYYQFQFFEKLLDMRFSISNENFAHMKFILELKAGYDQNHPQYVFNAIENSITERSLNGNTWLKFYTSDKTYGYIYINFVTQKAGWWKSEKEWGDFVLRYNHWNNTLSLNGRWKLRIEFKDSQYKLIRLESEKPEEPMYPTLIESE